MADTEQGLLINGVSYPVPELHTFDMNELEVMYEYCRLTLEDFGANEDETNEEAEARLEREIRHPGFKRTLLHVAYQRGNPDVKPVVVKKLIGTVNFLEAAADMLSAESSEDPTLLSPTRPDEPSETRTGSLNGSGGDGSTPTTTEPETGPGTTGTGGSDTSAPQSAPLRSVI